MDLSIVVIGDELLLGQVADTNSGFIARSVAPLGWKVVSVRTIADDAEDIYNAVDEAMKTSDAVITTGGLGPTKDDITKTTLCRYFNCGTHFDKEVEKNIYSIFEKRGLKMNDLTRNQAIVPDACKVIQNRFGTAPIMWFDKHTGCKDTVLVSMPGVPFETEGMLPEVIGALMDKFNPDIVMRHESFIVTDITESDLAARLDCFETHLPDCLHLAYLPSPGYIRLRLDGISAATDEAELQQIFADTCLQLASELSDNLLYTGDSAPDRIVLELATSAGLRIATAESCTGGTIASRLTATPGASECFNGGVVSYSNAMKIDTLGVRGEDIEQFGAVSREVVEQMSAGIQKVSDAECAIATSGIAGPGGGSEEKPVGTVWIAVRVADRLESKCYRFPGNRSRVVDRASTTALIMLAKMLKDLQ